MIELTMIGCGGTMPLPQRALASLSLRSGAGGILFDCGEGTQTAARRAGVSIVKTDVICLTHYHGDHILGLPGYLMTMAMQGRSDPVLIVGPSGMQRWLPHLLALCAALPFALHTAEIRPEGAALPLPDFGMGARLLCFADEHRVPCLGYRFELPRAGRFAPEKAQALGVPQRAWKRLQQGETVDTPSGPVRPEQVLGPARRGLAVVYSTDTRPCAALEENARGADLLFCDGTYADDADREKAVLYGHSTFAEDAALAARAGAARLCLTHFSPAQSEPAALLAPAQALFAGTEAGADGKRFLLSFAEN